jgi:hypothetical protein
LSIVIIVKNLPVERARRNLHLVSELGFKGGFQDIGISIKN